MKPLSRIGFTMLLFCTGCSSVNYGGFKVRSFGTDVAFKDAQWVKTSTSGTVEACYVTGAKRDATTSTHMAANLAMTALGALVGVGTGGAAAPAVGAVAGLSGSEIWQTVRDVLTGDKK